MIKLAWLLKSLNLRRLRKIRNDPRYSFLSFEYCVFAHSLYTSQIINHCAIPSNTKFDFSKQLFYTGRPRPPVHRWAINQI